MPDIVTLKNTNFKAFNNLLNRLQCGLLVSIILISIVNSILQ